MSKLINLNTHLYSAIPVYKDSGNRLCVKTKNIQALFNFIKNNVSPESLIKFISCIRTINTNQHGSVIKLEFVL